MPALAGAVRGSCSIEVPVGAKNQPGVWRAAVLAPCFRAEAVQRGQRATRSDFFRSPFRRSFRRIPERVAGEAINRTQIVSR